MMSFSPQYVAVMRGGHQVLYIADETQNKDIIALANQATLIKNGMSLAYLSQLGVADSRVMITMANQTQQDSRTMRIATVVAIVFLPANLVMV